MSVPDRVVIVDYGMGNLWSVRSAFQFLGHEPEISDDPRVVAAADTLVLPGVGSFRRAMETLEARHLADAIKEAVRVRGRKILGICLGMQVFADSGTEDGDTEGLGLIPGKVERFSRTELGTLKLPHIGFNAVAASPTSRLFKGITGPADFYFVHSYRLRADHLPAAACSLCRYGGDFVAAYEHGNLFATQFHPEKSQTNGLILLRNFLLA